MTTHLWRLWYEQPAEQWVEALPLGNGRLGAMVFDGVQQARYQLNEDTLWAGAPADRRVPADRRARDWNNPRARAALLEVREALFTGDLSRANELCKRMQGPFTQPYLTLGDLVLDFDVQGEPQGYVRELDLERAIASASYHLEDATYTREAFCSYPDRVLVVRLVSDSPGGLNFTARMTSPLRSAMQAAGDTTLVLTGQAPSHVDPKGHEGEAPVRYDAPAGLTFEARLHVVAQSGRITSHDDALRIEGADEVILLLAAATSFGGQDPAAVTEAEIASALDVGYAALVQRHVDDHQALFGRVSLDVGVTEAAEAPTDRRLAHYAERDDPQLAALIFQYGRYLLIASSRPGTQPANLQGIWNDMVQPPWNSNYTLNINAEMNYWPAEVCNLGECHEPLLQMIAELAVSGAETAEVNYGCHGWVAHHNSDLWRQSAPVGNFGDGDPVWAMWAMGGAWLCQHLWEHYLFTGDLSYLRERAYPLMKDAARFCLDWLVEDGSGRLVTAPATSPENKYALPGGERLAVSVASTMDLAIIWDLFTHCIEASETLGADEAFREAVMVARARLLPYQIGQHGQLQEWSQDWDDPDDHHRHVSHLFGVYPGHQLTPEETPELVTAARRSLELRGDGGTGWSMGWKINLWARFRDGDHAHRMLGNMLQLVDGSGTNYMRGGTYPNLFDAHPPFQIDGNFGATAGIAEMLLQSHRTTDDGRRILHVLPALPSAWPDGEVRGLRARGGFEIALRWRNEQLNEVTVVADRDARCRLQVGDRAVDLEIAAGASCRLDHELQIV